MQVRPTQIEKKFLFERRNQNHIGLHPALKTFQSRQGGCAILLRAGEGFLKGVIAGKNRRRDGDLLIALLDQLLENLRAGPQARVNLRQACCRLACLTTR